MSASEGMCRILYLYVIGDRVVMETLYMIGGMGIYLICVKRGGTLCLVIDASDIVIEGVVAYISKNICYVINSLMRQSFVIDIYR